MIPTSTMTDDQATILDILMRDLESSLPRTHKRLFNEIIDRNMAGTMTTERAAEIIAQIRRLLGNAARA